MTERVTVLVDQQQVMLPGGAQTRVEDVGGDLDGGGQQPVADPASADGSRPHDLLGALVESIEAGEQQFVERRWHVPLAGGGGELFGEERVAVGPFQHGTDQPIRWLRPEDAAELLGDVAGTEGCQPDVVDALDPLEFGEQPAQWIAALQVVGAVRRHQQHAGKLRASGENRQQIAGRSVRPMDVLDDEHDRLLAGSPTQCGRQCLGGSSPVAIAVAELGEHFVDRGVRCAALGDVEALPRQHHRTHRGGPLRQLGDQARLSDSSVATHEHGRRGTGHRCFQGDGQVPQLVGASHEPRTGHP